jgi:hypothetical protein
MKRRYVTIDVFTDRMFGGNPLAVVLDAAGLSTSQMQAIAIEFNYSETTFVLPPKQPDHSAWVRIFTPISEVPFAGHPNVGTAFALAREMAERNERVPGQFVFEEEAGLVPVTLLQENGAVIGAELLAPERADNAGERGGVSFSHGRRYTDRSASAAGVLGGPAISCSRTCFARCVAPGRAKPRGLQRGVAARRGAIGLCLLPCSRWRAVGGWFGHSGSHVLAPHDGRPGDGKRYGGGSRDARRSFAPLGRRIDSALCAGGRHGTAELACRTYSQTCRRGKCSVCRWTLHQRHAGFFLPALRNLNDV